MGLFELREFTLSLAVGYRLEAVCADRIPRSIGIPAMGVFHPSGHENTPEEVLPPILRNGIGSFKIAIAVTSRLQRCALCRIALVAAKHNIKVL